MAGASSLEIEDSELSRLKRGIGGQQLDDTRRVGSLLQLGEDEHLVGVCVVDARLACGNTLPRYETAWTPRRNMSSRSTHVADAMTTRPVLKSTAITDHVANAVEGSNSDMAAARRARMRAVLEGRGSRGEG